MATIEEPGKTAPTQSLSVDDMLSQAQAHAASKPSSTTTPELPPDIAAVKSKSVDEFLKEMNKMPLFMTELDETDEAGGENEALEAIKALAYEGEPREVALNFKEQGNQRFKEKNLQDAREFYTRALAVKCGDDDIDVACLNNRAQCNLELKNYRMALTDCRAAIKINPRSDKPWFRSAKALLALDKVAEAQACISNAQQLNPTHTQIQALAAQITSRREHLSKQRAARLAREENAKREKLTLDAALKARNIAVTKTSQPPDMPDSVRIRLENPDDPASVLSFPTILLYQPSLQSDFITAFAEDTTVEQQLAEVLAAPLEWDGEREFTASKVDCYMEAKTGGLVKVGKRVPLGKVLGGGKVEVQDGLVRIMVVPKGKRTEEFIEGWKRRMRT